jgi:hypothetical protein
LRPGTLERCFDEGTGVRNRRQLGYYQSQHDQPSGNSASPCSAHGISIATGLAMTPLPGAICRPADNTGG